MLPPSIRCRYYAFLLVGQMRQVGQAFFKGENNENSPFLLAGKFGKSGTYF